MSLKEESKVVIGKVSNQPSFSFNNTRTYREQYLRIIGLYNPTYYICQPLDDEKIEGNMRLLSDEERTIIKSWDSYNAKNEDVIIVMKHEFNTVKRETKTLTPYISTLYDSKNGTERFELKWKKKKKKQKKKQKKKIVKIVLDINTHI